jgi:NAD(P)-dependent dehydrogenase (short-subunit alcohol dehydrogenase family)
MHVRARIDRQRPRNFGLGHYGGISDNSDADVANMINVNYTGTVWTVRAAVPELRKAGGGDVVIVASVAGLRGDANEAVSDLLE